MKLFFIKANKSNQGFTLVETLVAVSIFSTSILALMSVLAQGVSSTNFAKTKIIASYLSQEGIEYIRNMRDTFMLYNATSAQAGWDAFNAKLTGASCQNTNGCYFDDQNVSFSDTSLPMTDLILTACSSSACPSAALLYNPATGKYNYLTGTSSGYVRKIRAIQASVNETKIFSTVSWTQGSGNYSVVLSESVFNWVE